MGQHADDILEGWSCGDCGSFFEQENGFPALCEECWKEDELPHDGQGWNGAGSMNSDGFQPSIYPLVNL